MSDRSIHHSTGPTCSSSCGLQTHKKAQCQWLNPVYYSWSKRFGTTKKRSSLTHCDTSLRSGRVTGHSDSWGSLSRQIFPMPIHFAVIRACELSDHVAMLGADPRQAAVAPTPHACVAPNPVAAISRLRKHVQMLKLSMATPIIAILHAGASCIQGWRHSRQV